MRIGWNKNHSLFSILFTLVQIKGKILKNKAYSTFFQENSNITLFYEEKYEDITIEVLNKVEHNQKVSITETELEKLKKYLGLNSIYH